jgi:ribosomal subunit interface protein
MQVQVSGHHLDVGDALRTHVAERLDASVGKYFDKPIDGHVTLTKEGYEVRADCAVHLNSGMRINVQGRATDPYGAFDAAVEKLDKRLRRYKSRLKSRNFRPNSSPPSFSKPATSMKKRARTTSPSSSPKARPPCRGSASATL